MASDNDLLIFGYACKVYHDDEKALHVENALIPWMGDETITIDRYDGRGHLNSLKEFEPNNGIGSESPSDDDLEEKLAESERWLSLNDEEAREEILKRAAAPVETHFSEVGFNYEENKAETFEDKVGVENRPRDFEDPDEKPYKVPKGLTIPVTVPRPDTRREHIIIQKTASFIARQGAQLEVVIKAKQKDNPQFAFMDIEHRLNLYYRFLIQQIKTGAYRPSETEENSDSDSDSSDDYLHPSLFAKSSTKSSGPPDDLKKLFKSSNKANCAYSQLISRIKPNVDEQQDSSQDGENALSTLKELAVVMPPPPDVQPIVDKMAEYVAKNGKDFEDSIRAKGDPKFEFVSPNHEFYEYYQYKLKEFRRSVADSATIKVVPSTVASPEVAEVKPKSPNALERIALDNSYHNSSIEVTPKIRRIEKKKLKINIKTQDKSLLSSEKQATGQSMIGPLLPSLYDDEDDVVVKEEVSTIGVPSNGRSCDELESKSSQESARTNATVETTGSANCGDVKGEWKETVVSAEDATPRSTKSNDQPKQDNDSGASKFQPEENSNSADLLEDPLKKKQLERKQKLAAFLSTLKSKKKDDCSKSEKKDALEENRPPSSSSAPTQPDLKSTIRNLKKAVVESDDERDVRKIDASKKYSNEEKYDSRRRSPSSSDRRHWRHKRRDRSRSQHSSDSDEDDRRHRRRDKKRRRSSSESRGSSAESRSRSYSSRKHHKSKSSRSRRE